MNVFKMPYVFKRKYNTNTENRTHCNSCQIKYSKMFTIECALLIEKLKRKRDVALVTERTILFKTVLNVIVPVSNIIYNWFTSNSL